MFMDCEDVILLTSSSPEKRCLLDSGSEGEENRSAMNQTMINNSRARLMSILQKDTSTPRYISIDISDDDDKEQEIIHTGLTQSYETFKLQENSNLEPLDLYEKPLSQVAIAVQQNVRKVKVKADALPEICTCPTTGLSFLQEELGVLPEVEWMTCLREDVQYVLWRYRSTFQPYDYVVAVVDLEKFYPFIESRSFAALFRNIFANYRQKNRFLYIMGVKKYVQKLQALENKHFKETLRSGKLLTPDRLKKASWPELEMDLCIAALEEKVKISIVPDGELGKYIVEMTKCIAWEPHANSQREELGDASGISGVRTGKDLTDTWRHMLMAIPKVSDATATSIQLNYPTVHSLRYAFQLHGCNALMNLSLGKRSLGSAMSSRIHAIFMKHSPDSSINN